MRSFKTCRAAALCLGFVASIGLVGCGGSGGGGVPGGTDGAGDDGGVDDGGMFFNTTRVETDWQVLYGADTNGIGSDKEGVVALESDPAGNSYILTDRRFQSDPNRRDVLFATVSSAGSLTTANLLSFTSNVSPKLMRRDPAGNFVMVVDALEVIKFDASGTLIWAKTIDRDPFAFGGMEVTDLQFDAAGNVYMVGDFNPSEPGDSMGFLAKLSTAGDGQWMRAWPHKTFFERQRLAVAADGKAYVIDETDGTVEFDQPVVLLGFAADGTPTGQHKLPSGSSALAVFSATLVLDGTGVSVVGLSGISRDGVGKTYLAQFNFDANLALTSIKGTQFDGTQFSGPMRAIRTPGGAVRAVWGLDGSYFVCEFKPGEAIAAVHRIARSPDLTSPIVDDDDYSALIASGPNEEWLVAGVSDEPGAAVLEPINTESLTIMVPLSNPGVSIVANTLVVANGATPYTVAADTAGMVNAPEANEEDALVFQASTP